MHDGQAVRWIGIDCRDHLIHGRLRTLHHYLVDHAYVICDINSLKQHGLTCLLDAPGDLCLGRGSLRIADYSREKRVVRRASAHLSAEVVKTRPPAIRVAWQRHEREEHAAHKSKR